MYLKITYEQEFDDLLMYLKGKYKSEIFDADGIGEQLDLSKFSRKFFSPTTSTTADASIDANSNVDDASVISYTNELKKPFERINSYYMTWKELKRDYGLGFANEVVERNIIGDIYINDFHGVGGGLPYSYYKETTIVVKENGNTKLLTMKDLFNKYKTEVEILPDREQINLSKKDIFVYDEYNKFVKLNYILRHKNTQGLLKLETKDGNVTIVTKDHPVILEDGSEKLADKLTLQDKLKSSNIIKNIKVGNKHDVDYGYFVGFFVGDGFLSLKNKHVFHLSEKYYDDNNGIINENDITSAMITLCQKDIDNSKIFNTSSKILKDLKVKDEENRKAYSCNLDMAKKLSQTGIGSKNRRLPDDILEYDRETLKAIVSGIIDSEGNINKENGIITVRVTSFALAQQLSDLIKILNCGKVRFSLVNKYKPSEKSYKSNHDLYRVSIRLTDEDFINYSEKVADNHEIVFSKKGKDGRFETSQLNKIIEYEEYEEYVYDITTETGHFYSEGMIQHNCYNYSTYDIMTNGLSMVKKVHCEPPKYLSAFKSQLEQFVVLASNSTLGACGLADLLVVMSYYVKNIINTKSDAHYHFATEKDCWEYVDDKLTSFVYTINQPMRGNQSPFTNVSVYDNAFLEKLSQDYIFPDGSSPDIELVKKIQILFLDIMNREMRRSPLTFPVTTACFNKNEEGIVEDKKFVRLIAEKNLEFAYINMYIGKSSTLSSCCRLRSETGNEYFNSFGSGSSKIGSLGVCTINLPRLSLKYKTEDKAMEELDYLVEMCAKINNAKRKIVKKRIENGNHPLYTLGFIDINTQYSTCGVNGFNEAINFLGKDILTQEGVELGLRIIERINKTNEKMQKRYKTPHNCEQIPGEGVSAKFAFKDKLMNYQHELELYSNQFIPLTTNADLLDRIRLQGIFDGHFSGGSILHCNVENRIEDVQNMIDLIQTCADMNVVYFAINYELNRCENGHMTVGKGDYCSICGKKITDKYLRVVGFITNIKNWTKVRREKDHPNRKFYKGI